MVVNMHATEVSREPRVHNLLMITSSHHHLCERKISIMSKNFNASSKWHGKNGSNGSEKQRPYHQTHNHNNLHITSPFLFYWMQMQ